MIGNDPETQTASNVAGWFESQCQCVTTAFFRRRSAGIDVQFGSPASQYQPHAGQVELIQQGRGGQQCLPLAIAPTADSHVGAVATDREADRAGSGMQRSMGNNLYGRVPRSFAIEFFERLCEEGATDKTCRSDDAPRFKVRCGGLHLAHGLTDGE